MSILHTVRLPGRVLALVACALLAGGNAFAATFAYISNADSQEISVLALDTRSGELTPVETVKVGGNVMPLAVSPDKRVLYAALRSQPYRVASFAIDAASGKLKKLGEA
ncbi:MAG: beta-propeller fold lactonase family protein, partial [Cytophagales bacterium]|nr:beta-propeller fold lactonase family protein [Rhizobacter sp.]